MSLVPISSAWSRAEGAFMDLLGGQGDDSDKIDNVYSEIRHVLHMRTEISDQEECAQWNLLVKHFQVQRSVSSVHFPFRLLNTFGELHGFCRVESKRHHGLSNLGHFF